MRVPGYLPEYCQNDQVWYPSTREYIPHYKHPWMAIVALGSNPRPCEGL